MSQLLASIAPSELPADSAGMAVPDVLRSPWMGGMLWSAVIIVLVVIAVSVYLLYVRQRDQRDAQQAADALFESQMIAMARGMEPDAGPAEPAAAVGSQLAPHPTEAEAAGEVGVSADTLCADVIERLRAAGMLMSVGEYIELHGNRKGAVVLELAGRRKALLVPHLESESFVHHNLRRYDCLIFVSDSGRAVIVNTLESAIAQRFSP